MTFDNESYIKLFKPKQNETPEKWHDRRFKMYENVQNHGQLHTKGHSSETKEAVRLVKLAFKLGLEGTIDV